MGYMGQQLLNPPSVEGWHQGLEWIDSGTLVERLNFAAEQLADKEKPGVRAMIDKITAGGQQTASAGRLVDACLDQLGAVSVSESTRSALIDFALKEGDSDAGSKGRDEEARCRVAAVLGLVASTPEFQRA
jgi:hypothetical protein